MTNPATSTDAELAARLASEAGEKLRALRRTYRSDAAPDDLRAAGDRIAQRFLAGALAAQRPDDAILSEEAPDDPIRLAADRVWIIDPLDGTREFGEGRADWAVHIALWSHGDLVTGAVALPDIAVTLSSHDVREVPARSSDVVRIAVSRSRPPAIAEHVAAIFSAQIVPMGSTGYKTGAVIRGEADAYLHAGGQHEWDSAAPVVVARAAGLHVSRLDGGPLRYNNPDTYIPDLLIARSELAERIVAAYAH